MRPTLRSLWLHCHRWTALSLGWVLIVAGLSGAALVVAPPLDRWLHPHYFVARGDAAGGRVALEAVRRALAAEFGPAAALTFRPPREAGETLQVRVRGNWRGTVFIDPASGREQGRRAQDEGFVDVLFGLHSALWMAARGKAVLACAAAAYLALLASGLVLWWPRRWPPPLRIEWRKGLLRALFDAHRIGGALLGLVLAVSVATGAFMAWRPIGGWINALARAAPPAVPALAGPPAPMLPLDGLVERAQAVFPGSRVGFVMLAPRADRPLRVRLRLPGEPHPNGMSNVWLDPRNGAVLAATPWRGLDPAGRLNTVIYPLHTGELGGVWLQAAVAAGGLALGALGGSGLWLWWRRRQARRARPAGRPARAEPR